MVPSSGLPSSSSHTNFAERYNPNPIPAPSVVRFADEMQDADPPRRGSLNNLNSLRKHQKRALDEYDIESDVPENPKKTRVEGDEFIDGDEDAEWLPRQKRGEKRVMHEDLEDEEDASPPSRRVRGKRARKVSLDKPDVFMTSDDGGEDMDVDEEDEWRDARPARGKKRDAGSSFGREEEEEEEDGEQETKRKRRTVGKRKSDAASQVPSRGQKRDRDADEDGSDAEAVAPGTPIRSSRKTKKRGKKSKEVQEDDEDGSVDEGSVSKGKGRTIGDEWESNGVLYKIGPNGQRMRLALVKKAARRFIMPLDSQHPDKNAALEVCIETWLTEEEYKDFKARHLLAWQDSPKGTQEPESVPSTPAIAEPPTTPTPNPVAKGKNLLWDSPASPFPTFAPSPAEKEQLRPKTHFRQSIAQDLGMRVNPFEKANALHVGAEVAKNGLRTNGRRVVPVRETLANPGLPGLADSTNSIAAPAPLRRTFSKWEKQDLEAKAMMKMREANQNKVKERELKEKLEREKKEREAAAAAPVPTISLTKPAEPAKPPAISFAPSTSSARPSASTPQPPLFSLAPPSSSAGPPKLSFGPTAPSGKPQQSTPNLFASPAAGAAPAAPLSNPFAKPTPSSEPTPAPAAKSNLFAPPAGASPSTTTTTPSFSFASGAPAANKSSPFGPPTDRPIAGVPTKKADSPFPAPGNAAPAPSNNAPSFSFAPPSQNPAPSAPTSDPAQSGGSLLSRMGGAPKPAEAFAAPPTFSFKPADQSKSAFAAPQQPKPAGSAFSFKPADQSAAPPQQPTTQAPAATTAPAPKFSFAFGGKPAAAPSTTPSSLTGALGSSEPKAAASPFSFAAPKPADKPTTTPAGAPSFSFGAPTSTAPAAGGSEQKKSAFGGFGGAGNTAAPAAGEGEKSAFGGFGGASTTPTPAGGEGEKKSAFGGNFGFGGAAAPAAPSAFGGGGVSSVFGGGATKSAFGNTTFGTPATKPAEEAAKPAPAFGATPPASGTGTPTPASAPAFSFAFGGNNASTTPTASPAANPFAAKPSAFGGPSVFGKPAGTETSTTPQGSPFGGFGTSTTTGPSAFGFGKPAEQK
ncbi:hypothetical protein C8R43DRAFT_706820 [Mycena crocata]|nr:hypothetical protein C8R43DRAFT_706820 [Mycena crocata]